jgi:hypothetical protein
MVLVFLSKSNRVEKQIALIYEGKKIKETVRLKYLIMLV